MNIDIYISLYYLYCIRNDLKNLFFYYSIINIKFERQTQNNFALSQAAVISEIYFHFVTVDSLGRYCH